MENSSVSTSGSITPETKVFDANDLWQKVVASRPASASDSEENVQVPAAAGVAGVAGVSEAVTPVPVPDGRATENGVAETGVTDGATSVTDGITGERQDAPEDSRDPPEDNCVSSAQVSTPEPAATSAMRPVVSAMVMGTANPVSSGLNQFVQTTFTLDRVKRLNPKGFPHPPKEGSDQIKPTALNLRHMFDGYGVQVVYDEIKKKQFIYIPGQVGSADNQDNVALAHIYSLATLNGMATSSIANLLIVIGDRNRRNPVKEWIQLRPWDGADRFEEFANTIQERKGYPVAMKKILLRKWLRSAIAAVLMGQGFHCRGVLVLQGKQSIGKSSWFQALISDAALAELVILLGHNLDPANKDSVLKAISHWIVELGELDSTFKKDIARVKGFLTSGSDKIRRPYGRLESEFPRRTTFCASVNDTCFLVDETGNSRFWTIAVESVNYQHGIDMQQLFAQIAVEFHAGAQWWLTQDEEMQLALVNADHRVVSMVRERLMAAIDTAPPAGAKTKAMSAIDVLQAAGIEKPTNPQCKECASILRELYGDAKKVQGRYVWRVVLADRGPFGSSGAASTTEVDDDLY